MPPRAGSERDETDRNEQGECRNDDSGSRENAGREMQVEQEGERHAEQGRVGDR